MLSDESSSDSETGRFKCKTKPQDEQTKSTRERDNYRSVGRHRSGRNDRFQREFDKREDRDRYERRSRERHHYSRHSPERRRYSRERKSRDRDKKSHERDRGRSRDRDKERRSRERERGRKSREHEKDKKTYEDKDSKFHERDKSHDAHRKDSESVSKSKVEVRRSESRERRRRSRSKSRKSLPPKRETNDNKNYESKIAKSVKLEVSRDKSSSPDYKKKSIVRKPPPNVSHKKKSPSPVEVREDISDLSDEVQPGSYYSMVPAIIKDKSEDSSETDSSDDERLRAKLLNLEKELQKTRKKKHKKKHRKKHSKSSKDKDKDSSAVEVSSTTDIDKTGLKNVQTETVEVTSTQKSNQKESSEEGEILSDDDSVENIDIDPTDLRHKLKGSARKIDSNNDVDKPEVCGPELPPHLKRRKCDEVEGPLLPPHLQSRSKKIGPSIPDELRKVLANKESVDVKYVSSDEDIGVGPLPAGAEEKWTDAHKKLEKRALDMKIRKLDGHSLGTTEIKTREQWMLELPEAKAKYLGLEARKFRAKEGPDMSDRSSWTDTPEEKARKQAGVAVVKDPDVALKEEARSRHIASRDEEQEKAVKKHKKKHKREESLLEIHQKKLKKKKKEKEESKSERRPFSRDVDLQVNRFDEAQKKSIIKKAQNLDSRFSRGEAKYL